ncbi:Zinc finger MYM-type protein 1-like [Oopsacas minuta]|uniref:Zinc finger MYM-type protein 1-like n=1 Tax=Oopsacas minuta TaxID=111878 RepID=A0AAV7K370_9METZ|nr:Zinc finger MYM-type protein 1-like [Oopsacas minuta]
MVLKEALVSLNLPFGNFRGQGYDGAANMSGCEHGLQAKVREENPRALWMYCFGHDLNLVVQDSMKDRDMENAIQKMHSVITFIKASPKRYEVFKKMAAQEGHYDRHEIRPLCPTRWVMRLASVDSMLLHYTTVLMQLETALDDRELKPDKRAETQAFVRSLEEFNTYFCIRTFQKLLLITNPIHVMCQAKRVTVGNVRSWVQSLIATLSGIGADEVGAAFFYQEVKAAAHKLWIDEPKLPGVPRARRGDAADVDDADEISNRIEELYVKIFIKIRYYELCNSKQVSIKLQHCFCKVFSSAATSLILRYSRQDLRMTELLRHSIEDPDMAEAELTELITFYDGDLPSMEQFKWERQAWYGRCDEQVIEKTWEGLRKVLSSEHGMRGMLKGMHTTLVLYLVLPATTCEAERSFSMLRWLLTYIRSMQGQEKLSGLAILN